MSKLRAPIFVAVVSCAVGWFVRGRVEPVRGQPGIHESMRTTMRSDENVRVDNAKEVAAQVRGSVIATAEVPSGASRTVEELAMARAILADAKPGPSSLPSMARGDFTPWEDTAFRYYREKFSDAPMDFDATAEAEGYVNDAFSEYRVDSVDSRVDCHVGICRMAFTFQDTSRMHALNAIPRPEKWELKISSPQQSQEGTTVVIYALPSQSVIPAAAMR